MLKKLFTAAVSAVLCGALTLGITAFGQSVFCRLDECSKLANSGFEQKYVDWAIKYHNKETGSAAAYKKSRSKKFIDKFHAAVTSKKPQYTFELSDKNYLFYIARKDGKIKQIYHEVDFTYDICGSIITLADGDNVTVFGIENKTKTKPPQKDYTYYLFDDFYELFDFDDISETGKSFKFKSGGKAYYYEEFKFHEDVDYPSNPYVFPGYFGFLFDEDGNALALVTEDMAYYMSFKASADGVDFTQPKGYKTVAYDDFMY